MKTSYLSHVDPGAIEIPLADTKIEGFLRIPSAAYGVVIFAHGSGSSRFSYRNRFVADDLFQANMGTLLFDLLTEDEEEQDRLTGAVRFNIAFLARRLGEVTDWLMDKLNSEKIHIPIGYFGASTGAAAAIEAAVRREDAVKAIVSRGGRPDLAALALPRLNTPTLLIVGGCDKDVLRLNRQASRLIPAPVKIHIVPGATHLFEEPGALEEVARTAAGWFKQYLKS